MSNITTSSSTETRNKINPTIVEQNITLDQDFWYHESLWLDVSPDGWTSGRASLDGSAILFGNADLSALLPFDILDKFQWVQFDTWQTQNPWDENVEINFRFQTNNPTLAEQLSIGFMNLLGSQIPFNTEFVGSWGSDDWDGENWVQMTDVKFRGHLDWINMLDLINTAIPRNYGGIAASIDASFANGLSFHFWLEHHNLNIAGSIGISFGENQQNQIGGHVISLGDFFHVDSFTKADWATDFLHIDVALPNATNPAFDIFNNAGTTITWDYHPSPEGHNKHHYWSGHIQIDEGFS
ncbi:MAG: hypothetical protein ACXAD7_20790, partial [Candidatus Kariarchaeaceae archaeon]